MLGYKLLEEIDSPLNGKIKIYSIFGRSRMEIGGLLQSGGIISQIWKKAAKQIVGLLEFKSVGNILVLGLGAGTAVEEILKIWPTAKIIGVEIDQKVVEAGRKYFRLKEFEQNKHLKVVVNDALKEVKKLKTGGEKFDLILVDIYQGDKFVDKFWQKPFLSILRQLLSKNSTVVFNHLFWGKHKERSKCFVADLAQHFPNIRLSRVLANLLIFAGK